MLCPCLLLKLFKKSLLEPPAPLRVAQVGPPCLTFLRHWLEPVQGLSRSC